jgi:hypothetical protein
MRRKRLQPFLGVLALRDEERWRCPYIPKSLVGLETASGHISLNLKSIPFSQSLLEGERGKTSPFLVDSPDGYDLQLKREGCLRYPPAFVLSTPQPVILNV